jgi:hypothetical protein
VVCSQVLANFYVVQEVSPWFVLNDSAGLSFKG